MKVAKEALLSPLSFSQNLLILEKEGLEPNWASPV